MLRSASDLYGFVDGRFMDVAVFGVTAGETYLLVAEVGEWNVLGLV